MNRLALLIPLALAAACLIAPAAAQQRADTLLLDRAAASKTLSGPKRGTTMAQVEATFGTPQQKLEPRGGQQPQWPVINRWVYPEFTVYFEHSHVIDVVARHATPGEIGPKPVH